MPRKRKVEEQEVLPADENAIEIIPQEEPVVEPEFVPKPEQDYGPEFAELVVTKKVVLTWEKKAWTRPNGLFNQVRLEPKVLPPRLINTGIWRAKKGIAKGGTLWVPEGYWHIEFHDLEKGPTIDRYDAFIKP